MQAIELDGLERRYGERVALAGVSVRVEAGQTLAVLGGNGAGKTTLLRVLAGLLRPHGGRATVLDAELPRERWRLPGQVGYLGHEPLLYRDLSGRENLRYHARLHGVAEEHVETVLAQVEMERRAGDPVVGPNRHADGVEQGVDPRAAGFGIEPVESGGQREVLASAEVAVEQRLVAEVAHPPAEPVGLRRQAAAQDRDLAAAGAQQARQDPQQRRLAGPVRSEHGQALAAPEPQVDAVQGGAVAELAPQPA